MRGPFLLAGSARLGEFEAVAPGFHAIGFDLQVQPLAIGQLIGFVLVLGVAALRIGQHGGFSGPPFHTRFYMG
jgi:hypothetical protein